MAVTSNGYFTSLSVPVPQSFFLFFSKRLISDWFFYTSHGYIRLYLITVNFFRRNRKHFYPFACSLSMHWICASNNTFKKTYLEFRFMSIKDHLRQSGCIKKRRPKMNHKKIVFSQSISRLFTEPRRRLLFQPRAIEKMFYGENVCNVVANPSMENRTLDGFEKKAFEPTSWWWNLKYVSPIFVDRFCSFHRRFFPTICYIVSSQQT